MSADARHPDAGHGAHGHGRPLDPERGGRVLDFTFGLLLVSEAMAFVTLVATRYVLLGSGQQGLSQVVGALVTVVAAASVVPAWHAASVARSATADGAGRPVATTLAAGGLTVIAFLVQAALLLDGPSTLFAEYFLAATGVWAAVAVGSLVGLLGVASALRRGTAGAFAVRAAAWQWIFTAAVWIVLYVVFYVV